jgi:ubiquinone/menaquinone biosynthesis C-methylase UbiE
MTDTEYVLGHSAAELRRLEWQAELLGPYTARLFAEAGIRPGMRILDVGCGAGDVTMLVAGMVGPSGSVLAIDPHADAVALAEARIEAAGQSWVRCRRTALADLVGTEPFDAVVWRCVLMHQSDPAAFLRTAARYVRPGGVIALQESDAWGGGRSTPLVPLWRDVFAAFSTVFQTAGRPDMSRLFEYFADAGLPQPEVSGAIPLGGHADSPVYWWVAESIRSLLPLLEPLDIGADVTDVDTLEDRLRAAVLDAHSQVEGPPQFMAWTRL